MVHWFSTLQFPSTYLQLKTCRDSELYFWPLMPECGRWDVRLTTYLLVWILLISILCVHTKLGSYHVMAWTKASVFSVMALRSYSENGSQCVTPVWPDLTWALLQGSFVLACKCIPLASYVTNGACVFLDVDESGSKTTGLALTLQNAKQKPQAEWLSCDWRFLHTRKINLISMTVWSMHACRH